MPRTLHLAQAASGVGGPGANGIWKDPRVPKNSSIDINYYIRSATIAEQGLFDAFFIADSQYTASSYAPHDLNRLEPLTLLSAVATHTTNIGLVATASTTYNSPFNLARQLASLDHISGGRAAWNVVTGFDPHASQNFGLDEHLDYPTRYGRAREFVEVARGLWDSYEDDAFPADVERGVFLNHSKLHAVNHVGEHFKVAGPLNLSRSRQGQPVIFQAGVSEEGRTLAADVAEAIYAPGTSLDEARAYYSDIKRRVAAQGRAPDHVVVFVTASPVVQTTDTAARERARETFEQDNDFDRKLVLLGRAFGAYDFSRHDLDAPFPDLTDVVERFGRRGEGVLRRARESGWTLRQAVDASSHHMPEPFVGSPKTVAGVLQRWFENAACDGFNIWFRTLDDQQNFVETVVPILQARGLYRTEYEADTLRGNLDLPFPVNRYAHDLVDAQGV